MGVHRGNVQPFLPQGWPQGAEGKHQGSPGPEQSGSLEYLPIHFVFFLQQPHQGAVLEQELCCARKDSRVGFLESSKSSLQQSLLLLKHGPKP